MSGRFGAEKNFLPLPAGEKTIFLESLNEDFGLLFSSFDKFKIFKSHYVTLRFLSMLIKKKFISQISGIKQRFFQTTNIRKNCGTLPSYAMCNSLLRPVIWLMTAQTTTDSLSIYTGLFISPSGISELDCSTTKTDTAERSISIGRESLQVFFVLGTLAYFQVPPLEGSREEKWLSQ